MSEHQEPAVHSSHLARPKPPGFVEFTPRAIVCGLIVALIMGASYPYVVLKLGFGPNVSVVAAIFGYVILGLVLAKLMPLLGFRYARYNRWENNIVQTAGTAAAQTAFMCVLLAAFDMLAQSKVISFNVTLSPIQSFAWLSAAGLLGVFLAIPLRRHYIVEEKLPFADGIAAGETIMVCDSEGPIAVRAATAMLLGIAASALVMLLTEDAHLFNLFDSTLKVGTAVMYVTGFGINWSLLAAGSGMLISMRINFSMLIGTILSWIVAPYLLLHYGVIGESFTKTNVLFWVMWPATGMMVAGGLTALFLRWRTLAKTFKNLTVGVVGADEFPIRWTVIGATASAAALILVQYLMFDQAVWITAVAIVLSIPLALVGLRVLGETNWGPISALSNMMQGVFALLAPGNVSANMVASGTTGTIAIESEAIMQDYKAGDMVGSSPRYLTYMQLLATPVGAAAVACMYPVLRNTYGIGEEGLSSPISRKWAGFAEILSEGFNALPPGAFTALLIGTALGVVLAVLEMTLKNKTWIPSPTGMGIGMLVPAAVIVMMVIGGLIGKAWSKADPRTSGLYLIPLASGLIAGEALVAVVIPVLLPMLQLMGVK